MTRYERAINDCVTDELSYYWREIVTESFNGVAPEDIDVTAALEAVTFPEDDMREELTASVEAAAQALVARLVQGAADKIVGKINGIKESFGIE